MGIRIGFEFDHSNCLGKINDFLRRLTDRQMVTPPQHESPRDHPAQRPERGIQILEIENRD
ncbi:hypothetical protein PanWU01x14_231890 [Parasponia andersonii]|uniref:Uncharacterized protein n=1 Tax=Parasponia andersonii TaxID=3476 RepID=A0A2P5BK91_PARAD|nr:hypothetical protein PanWU01x14_231890 [Parasponia andersonii]